MQTTENRFANQLAGPVGVRRFTRCPELCRAPCDSLVRSRLVVISLKFENRLPKMVFRAEDEVIQRLALEGAGHPFANGI